MAFGAPSESSPVSIAVATYARLVTMFSDVLRRDRERWGFTVGQLAWRLGVSVREYREIEAGARYPGFDTYDRIGKLFGWPRAWS